jgi:hypothetical protein
MKARTVRKWGTALGCLAAILVFCFTGVISWAITCGIIKLITLCFGWTFSWLVATGVWLILWLVKMTLNKSNK